MKKAIIALTVLAGFAAFVPAANAGYYGYGSRYYSGSHWCDDCGSYRSWNYSRWDECDD